MSVNKSWTVRAVAAAAVATLLVGCFGGGGGGGDGGGGSESASVGVRVIDGAIQNALVCLDTNLNGACDAGEPSARTNAAGDATLSVAPADAGRFPVLAMVGTDAIDADHGPVTVPFVMKAPADQPAVVSPLTTLVQNTIEQSGVTTEQAAATLQNQLGMNVSVMQDYTQTTSTTEGGTLAAVARMVVVTQQQQSTALSGAVGSTAIDGTVITQADLDKLITQKIAEMLPAIVGALANPTVQAAILANDPGALNTALQPLAGDIVADSGLTPTSAATLVAVNNQAAAPETVPAAGTTLHTLTFTSAQNWFRRVTSSTTAQATPDASGNTRFGDNRLRSRSGVLANWSFGGEPDRQSDLHWNGSAWVGCPLAMESTNRREADGRNTYSYCDGYEVGANTRAAFDIAGKSMLEVYNQIRAAGYTNITIDDAASALGSATFPANSRIVYVNGTPTSTAVAYLARPGQIVRMYSTDALAAGDATACNNMAQPFQMNTVEATTLESLVARTPGKPCVYGPESFTGANGQVTSGPRNESWGPTTLNIGNVGTAPLVSGQAQATSFFTSNQMLRAAFGPNNSATYYSCRQTSWDGGSTRNCDVIGSGSYSISTLGDARILTFQGVPPAMGALGYERVFVERGGKVYYGYKNKPNPYMHARFPNEAGNALLTQLGLASVAPGEAVVPRSGSYQGDWLLWPSGVSGEYQNDNAAIVRLASTFTGSGAAAQNNYQCFDTVLGQATGSFTCTFTLNPATGAFTFTDASGSASGTMNVVDGSGSGSFVEGGTTTPIVLRRR